MFLNPVFVWAIIGLLLVGSEFFVPGVVIIFFGIGALFTAILSAIIPGLRPSIAFQILIWLGASGLSLAFLRRYLSRIFKGKTLIDDGSGASGKTAGVIEAISPEKPGRVRFEGTTWKAQSYTETFKPGDTVEILKQEGLTLIVTKSILDLTFDDETKEED